MTKTKHTAPLWAHGMVTRYTDGRLPERDARRDEYNIRSVSTYGMEYDVFCPEFGPSTTDSKLIVTAVNERPALLAVLKTAKELVEHRRDREAYDKEREDDLFIELDAALGDPALKQVREA